MRINEFKNPTEHPFGVLEGCKNAYQKETVLRFILEGCIEAGAFVPVTTRYNHPDMIEDGLLIETGPSTYELTEKAKGLLYSVYHK